MARIYMTTTDQIPSADRSWVAFGHGFDLKDALQELSDTAKSAGAHAVVGLRVTVADASGQGGMIFFVYGTALHKKVYSGGST
ncbi:heavy metal-binding domain-containing protein [Streptomyces sp. Lzd4kr]|nr:heavy metal-binding domain-containing protein [Streptomyces sp. Lzd4kr]